MQDIIQKIIEIDKRAQKMTDEAQELRKEAEASIESDKKALREQYLERARRRIAITNETEDKYLAGMAYLAAALATGLSGIGGGIAVAKGSTAAIGALSEDPNIFGRAILFVGLGEGVAIYGFVISVLIVLKL